MVAAQVVTDCIAQKQKKAKLAQKIHLAAFSEHRKSVVYAARSAQ